MREFRSSLAFGFVLAMTASAYADLRLFLPGQGPIAQPASGYVTDVSPTSTQSTLPSVQDQALPERVWDDQRLAECLGLAIPGLHGLPFEQGSCAEGADDLDFEAFAPRATSDRLDMNLALSAFLAFGALQLACGARFLHAADVPTWYHLDHGSGQVGHRVALDPRFEILSPLLLDEPAGPRLSAVWGDKLILRDKCPSSTAYLILSNPRAPPFSA